MNSLSTKLAHHVNRATPFFQMVGVPVANNQSADQPNMHSIWYLVIIFIAFFAVCNGQCNSSVSCYPTPGNLVLGRTVEVSSECLDQICPDGANLTACENASAKYINDGNIATYWVSQIQSNLTLPVVLQVNLEAAMTLYDMSLLWESSTPYSMVLERSNDFGLTWTPYRYWSYNCLGSFGLMPSSILNAPFQTQDAICTEMQLSDQSGAEVTFYTSSHLPPSATQQTIDNYQSVTNLRINLIDLNNISMIPECARYFAISEWIINGTCMCNGHAEACRPAPLEDPFPNKIYAGCMCGHRTEGLHCEQCQTGFNQVSWMAGPNECQACECNGHADDCIAGFGCINCTDNTMGDNCSLCVPGYYANSSLLPIDTNYCTACNCDEGGVIDDGQCDNNGTCNCKIGTDPPKCSTCASGYWNFSLTNINGCQACECGEGAIEVNSLPVCDKVTGICVCKSAIVLGDKCDSCMDGFYDLSSGCSKSCQCNTLGSVGISCDSTLGQCYCKTNVTGTLCNEPASGYYFKAMDDLIMEAEEAQLSPGTKVYWPLEPANDFTGRGYAVIPANGGQITFSLQVPKSTRPQYLVVLRYSTDSAIFPVTLTIESQSEVLTTLQCTNVTNSTLTSATINQMSLSIHFTYHKFESFCFQEGVQYRFVLSYAPLTGIEWLVDSLVLMPDVAYSPYHQSMGLPEQLAIDTCLPYSLSVIKDLFCRQVIFDLSIEFYGQVFACEMPSLIGSFDGICDSYGGTYMCKSNYTGSLCNQCSNGFYNYTDDMGCQICPPCNSTGSQNVACDAITGECHCKSGVDGTLCDACQFSHFNFSETGCKACNCSQFAIADCDETGMCLCPIGVTGQTCDRCLDGYYQISQAGCVACGCNPNGSVSNTCNKTTGQCMCQGGAIGLQCSACPSEHYQTPGVGQDFCVPCFCHNHSMQCVGDSTGYVLTTVESDFTILCSSQPTDCNDDWSLVDGNIVNTDFGPNDASGLGYTLLNGLDTKLVAPNKFHGDFHLAYGQKIEIVLVHPPGVLTPTRPTYLQITGSKLSDPLVATLPSPVMGAFNFDTTWTFTIPLTEDNWRVGSNNGNVSSINQFMTVLVDITDIRFSAKYTNAIFEFIQVQWFKLYTLQTSVPESNSSGMFMSPYTVESCSCPLGHIGQFCDQCHVGYYRLSGNPLDPCLPCQCNGLAVLCNETTGVCIDCMGYSQGDQCEECIPGYYDSDPTDTIQCLQCQCPTVNNSHSATCVLDSNDMQLCDACETGYTGVTCEKCANGYYGDPINGQCQPCECNGNIDPSLGLLVCNASTGKCMNCLNHTEGLSCEKCIEGYYGDVQLNIPCQACNCNPNGTLSEICERYSGYCFCKDFVALPNCSQCQDGYYGNPAMGGDCLPCPCPSVNNSHSSTCFLNSNGLPVCDNCEVGYTGDNCQFCADGYYGDAVNGFCNNCVCNGNVDPALGPTCDMVSGQCLNCQNNTFGFECQLCLDGYYGDVANGIPCKACNCNSNGTLPQICERNSGFCFCKPLVAMPDCSQCIDGYYGDPSNGGDCLQCQCPNISNSHSPTCVLNSNGLPICNNCEDGYTGDSCQFCDNGYFGDAVTGVCTLCQCYGNVDPTLGLTCNVTTGQCLQCQNHTTGFNCDQCLPGFYGDIPNGIPCQECSCNRNGTEESVCNRTTGACLCLPQTEGSDCGQCESGYWGLSQGLGCVSCNCCTNGSISLSCDQDTGDCSCLHGVGGINDTKCCRCSFGYYNLSDTGCTACNCGELSQSMQCDENGRCPCQAGGIGDKCNECAFGFIGNAPNCTRCHDCYFLWFDTLSTIKNNVTFLIDRIQEVLKFYEGFTEQDIKETILNIEAGLNMTSQVLSTITVNPDLLTNITAILNEVIQTYGEIVSDVNDLQESLRETYMRLSQVQDFIDSVESDDYLGIDVTELYKNITALNKTIAGLEAQANASYALLTTYQLNVIDLNNTVADIYINFSLASNNIGSAYNISQQTEILIESTQSFAVNISAVNTAINKLENDTIILENGTVVANISVERLTNNFITLDNTLKNLNEQLSILSNLANNLQASANSAKTKADLHLAAVQNLMTATNQALADAQSLIAKVGLAQELTSNATNKLEEATQIAQDILAIPNPPVNNASKLANDINGTIIPEEDIAAVVTDANNSAVAAIKALEIAENTSSTVQDLQNVVNDVKANYTATITALEEAQTNFEAANSDADVINQTLNEVESTLDQVPNINTIQSTINDTLDTIDTGETIAQEITGKATNASTMAQQILNEVTDESNKLQTANDTLTNITQQTAQKITTTDTVKQTVNQLQDKAQQLNDTANAVSLQKLKNLLATYQTKLSQVQSLRAKMASLQTELKTMTEKFKISSEKYKNCYKTP